jgi:hypothetical protein
MKPQSVLHGSASERHWAIHIPGIWSFATEATSGTPRLVKSAGATPYAVRPSCQEGLVLYSSALRPPPLALRRGSELDRGSRLP